MEELVRLLTIFVYATVIFASIRLILLGICYIPEIIDRISFNWSLKKMQSKTPEPAKNSDKPTEWGKNIEGLKTRTHIDNGCERLEKTLKQAAATLDENAIYIAGDFLRPDEPIEIVIRIENSDSPATIEYSNKILSLTKR